MQLKPAETIDQDHDSLQDEEHDSLQDNKAEDDELTTPSDKIFFVEDTSTWSFIPPALQEEERSILPVDSSDSIPSRYALSKDNNDDLIFRSESSNSISSKTEALEDKKFEIKEIEEKATEATTISINTSVQTEPVAVSSPYIEEQRSVSKNLEIIMEKLNCSKMLCLWIISIIFTVYFIRLSGKQSRELYQLQQEIDLLRKTISEMEQANMKEHPGWILKGSKIVKEWTSTMKDLNTNDFLFASPINETTYLDTWPSDALNVMKNISLSMSSVFNEVFEDTRDVFFTASESFSSVGNSLTSVVTVSESFHSLSETMSDIWNAQKYALVFGALYFKIYENYFQDGF